MSTNNQSSESSIQSLEKNIQSLVSKLSVRLIFKRLKAITVESCTGGLIGKVLTDPAGSSEWFAGGLITYTNESKTQLAAVPPSHFDDYGAVSVEVVDAMARGAHQHFMQCVSVAVSGVAGPGGGSEDKPVGTVCIATCVNDKVDARKYFFSGGRQVVRLKTVEQALLLLLSTVEKVE